MWQSSFPAVGDRPPFAVWDAQLKLEAAPEVNFVPLTVPFGLYSHCLDTHACTGMGSMCCLQSRELSSSVMLQELYPKRLTNLKWIHSCTAGVEGVLWPGLIESNVIVTNARVREASHCDILPLCPAE